MLQVVYQSIGIFQEGPTASYSANLVESLFFYAVIGSRNWAL